IPFYFTTDAAGGYSGGPYGENNNYSTYSKPSDRVTEPTYEACFMDYAEVEFLLAEAVERNFNVGGTAAEHYEAGIRGSIEYWGGTTTDADAYLANPLVAYATSPGDWKVKIGTQKWIALYNRGFESWTEWRRFDVPTLNVPPLVSGYSDIPVRYTYPSQEVNLNGANRSSAASAIGGDAVQTKLFWDKF
ncbi:MAG TPA: SusD/RagB family nutrient-binding outer membrane lipoprotein, partial [Saprospiraceae bacterium]|nr:SusD/RagB family nutrient-binding outer membrane lipoprotein [Saprospiraceae bacterium]